MKRFLLLLMACATMFASCQKDADLAMDADGGMVDVTVSASMEGASATTRAITDKGTGATVDRCIMEVYTKDDGVLYKRMVVSDDDTNDSKITTETDGTRKVTFDLRLVASQTYDFLFWADKDNDDATNNTDTESYYDSATRADGQGDKHYTTTGENGLKAVTAIYTNYVGNDESRDAFFGQLASQKIESSVSLPVTLKRPFGQLNVSTALTDVPSDMYPAKVKVKYTTEVCTTLNVLDGETDDSKRATIEWADAVTSIDYSGYSSGDMHLSTDYIFAPYYAESEAVKQQLVDFEMAFYANGDDTTPINTNTNFKSIPIQRNYRTNVSGELLTKQGTINVTIAPVFDNDNSQTEIGVYEVATAADIPAILKNTSEESVYIKVATKLIGNAYINIDNVSSTVKEITVEYAEVGSEANLYFGKDITSDTTLSADNNSTYAGILNIVVAKNDAGGYDSFSHLYVYMSSAHVTFAGNATTGATVWTGSSTFVMTSGSSVGTLTVEGGNVSVEADSEITTSLAITADNDSTTTIEVAGTVNKIEVSSSSSITSGEIIIYDGGSVAETSDTESKFTTSTYTSVSTLAQLQTAIADTDVIDITLTDNIQVASASSDAISILRSNLTINGGGYTISGYATKNNILIVGGENKTIDNVTIKDLKITQSDTEKADYDKTANNGITVYGDAEATLENVTITNMGKYALVVNASTVTASGLTTSDCSWGGVNVSKGSGTDLDGMSPTFNFVSGSIGEGAIVVDGVDSWSVTTPADETWYSGYYDFSSDGTKIKYIYTQTEFSDYYAMAGSGTEDDPYLITMAEQLVKIGTDDYSESAFYQLENDIDMTNVSVGNLYINTFKGTFDGQGNTISNTTAYALIGYLYGTVKDLKLDNISHAAGGLSFYIYPGAHVDNCDVTGTLNGTYRPSTSYAYGWRQGGIAIQYTGASSSDNIGILIENCDMDLTVTFGSNIGGILGYATGAYNAKISHCTVTGSISGDSYDVSNSAGIVGQGGNSLTIEYCTNNATIKGYTNMAGIINSASNSTIINCTNNGNVTAPSSSTSTSFAGIATAASSATITSCTNNGDVYGYRIVGGITTYATESTITGCKNTGELTATNQVRTTGTAKDPCCGGIVAYVSTSGTYPTITDCASNGDIYIPNATEAKASVYAGVYVGCQTTYGVDISTVLESDYLSKNTSDCAITYSDTTVTYKEE